MYSGGGWIEVIQFRFGETRSLILPLLAGIVPRTAALMLWGMAVWRCGVLRTPADHKRKLLGTCICAAALFAVGARTPLVVAVAYVSGLLLALPAVQTKRLLGLAAVGQMALTNYVAQSVVLGFVFYGYGFGLFGHAGSAATAALGLLLYVAQVEASKLWLRRFRFGPLEWAWRSLTYGRWQPMRRAPALSPMAPQHGSGL
jgi:uncharacterized protein